MAKTVAEAKAKGDAYFEAWDAGYWVGFDEGGNDTLADFDALLDSFNLPFEIDEMEPMEVIREMAKRIEGKKE